MRMLGVAALLIVGGFAGWIAGSIILMLRDFDDIDDYWDDDDL